MKVGVGDAVSVGVAVGAVEVGVTVGVTRDGEGRGRRRRRRVQLRRDAELERLLDVERLAAELIGGVGADRREARLELHLVTEQLLAVELGARLLVVLVGRHAEPPGLHDVHGERAELVDDDRREAWA